MKEDVYLPLIREFSWEVILKVPLLLKKNLRINLLAMKYIYLKILVLTIFSLTFCAVNNNEKEYLDKEKKIQQINSKDELSWPWRGITLISHSDYERVTENSIEELGKNGVNLIRLRISFRKYQELNKVSKEESWKKNIEWSKKIISFCASNNIVVLISHSDFPLDADEKNENHTKEFWENPKALNQSILDINKITKTFDTIKGVVAYEFFSEPVVVVNNKSLKPITWDKHFKNILAKVRETSTKYLVYTPGPWADPKGYLKMGKPFQDQKIIYNFHFYQPHRYTHQGIKKEGKYSYPGQIESKYWDKSEIEKEIDKVYNWSNKYNVKHVFVGEFSAVRWAKGKDQYLKDVIEILEKKKFSWVYFSFNGWKGWNYNFEFENEDEQKISNLIEKKEAKTNSQILLEKNWGLNKQKN